MIGIFDSGVGGLTVWKAVSDLLPQESFLYFGDTARVPYGGKSASVILTYAEEIATYLVQQGVKLLVVACHTASAYALSFLEERFQIPVIGVIQVAANQAITSSKTKRIAVLGTRATIGSCVYPKLIQKEVPDAFVLSLACPLLVPLAEEGMGDHPATRLIIQDYLKPVFAADVDTVLLGCTHYPLLKQTIQDCLGSSYTLVDAAFTCAEKIEEILTKEALFSKKSSGVSRFFVSDDPSLFQKSAQALLNLSLENVSHAKIARPDLDLLRN